MTLQEAFPVQFEGGPYFLGISIGPGWEPIVREACREVQAALTDLELAQFHWTQIKEKFGGLCMYWGPHNVTPVDVMSGNGWFHFDAENDEPTVFPQATVERIEAIVERAVARAAATCETCGAPGQLYRKGMWVTLCERHAHEQNTL